MPAKSNVFFHTLLMFLGIGLVYWWLSVPSLQQYSLQAFAASSVLYFTLKAISKKKFWYVLPTFMSVETVLATIALLLLVGATGNTSSWFYPLTYVLLFLVIFSSQTITSIITTLLIMLFHFGLSPQLVKHDLISLFTLPIIMLFFLFAKHQHQAVIVDGLTIKEEEKTLKKYQTQQAQTLFFLESTLTGKLAQIETLLDYPQENLIALKTQLKLIGLEIEKLRKQLRQK